MKRVRVPYDPPITMDTETTAIRTPMALHFDRAQLAVDIERLQKYCDRLEEDLAEARKRLADKQNKMNQLALIAIGRLRKRNG